MTVSPLHAFLSTVIPMKRRTPSAIQEAIQFSSSPSGPGGKRARSFSVALKLLGLEVARTVQQNGIRTVLVASAYSGDGRTTVTAGVSRALAGLGMRVTAVEAGNGTRDLLAALAGFERTEEQGWLTSPDRTIAVAPGITVYPGWALPQSYPDPEEVPSLLRRLTPTADVVVLDSTACTVTPDAYVMAAAADAVLYVVRKRQQDVVEQRSVIARFGRFNAKVLGAIYNGSSKP